MSILSNSAKFYAGRTVLPAHDFVGHNGLYLQHLSFGVVTSLKLLVIENMPRITVQLRIVDQAMRGRRLWW